MRIAMISALMLTALTGCIKTADNSEVTVADHEAQVTENCFSSLVAGPRTSSGKLEKISYAHGICQGSSRALDKLSEQTSITIIKGGQEYDAAVYIQGQDVIANIDGLNVKIGAVSKNPDDAELSMNVGSKLELAVVSSDGKSTKWIPGSTAKGKEIIRLTIN